MRPGGRFESAVDPVNEMMQHAVAIATAVAIAVTAWWGGAGTAEPPENMDGLLVEDE